MSALSISSETFREENMAKVFKCRLVVPGCDFVIHGESTAELLMKAAEHLRISHDVDHPSEQLKARIRSVVGDETAPTG